MNIKCAENKKLGIDDHIVDTVKCPYWSIDNGGEFCKHYGVAVEDAVEFCDELFMNRNFIE